MVRSQDGLPPTDEGSGTRQGYVNTDKVAPALLPPWKVLLHSDGVNDQGYVIETILTLMPLTSQEAAQRTDEADRTGRSLLLTTHRERAELYERQLGKRDLLVTIEPVA